MENKDKSVQKPKPKSILSPKSKINKKKDSNEFDSEEEKDKFGPEKNKSSAFKKKKFSKFSDASQSLHYISDKIKKKQEKIKQEKKQKEKDDPNIIQLRETHKQRILQFESKITEEEDLVLIQGSDFNVIHKLHLDFWMYEFEDEDDPLKNIVAFVSNLKQLESLILDISECELDDQKFFALGDIFEANKTENLIEFDFYASGIQITGKGLEIVSIMLSNAINLQKLDIILSGVYFDELSYLSDAIKYQKKLKKLTLNLSHCELSAELIDQLTGCFSTNLEFLDLNLSGSLLDVVDYFPPLLKPGSELKYFKLSLGGSFLEDKSIVELIDLFKSETTNKPILVNLKVLHIDLSSNQLLTSQIHQSIVTIISALPALTQFKLDLRNNTNFKQDEILYLKSTVARMNDNTTNNKYKDVQIFY